MKPLYPISILVVSVLFRTNAEPPPVLELLPPMPPTPIEMGYSTTNAPVIPDPFREILIVEFHPVCSCEKTNHYRVVLSVTNQPNMLLTIPLQTSTDLTKSWENTKIEGLVPVDAAQRFFRCSGVGMKIAVALTNPPIHVKFN